MACLAGSLSAQTLSNYQYVVSSQAPGTYFKLDNSLASSVDPGVVLEQNLATGGGFMFDVFGNPIRSYFFANQTDYLRTAGTNIISGGGASNTVSTATGSITLLFRTLDLGANTGQRYVFSGGGATEDHNALTLFLENDNIANGDPNSYKLRFGDNTITVLQASNVVADAWYYFALTYNESSANVNKAKWYIGRAGGDLTSGLTTNAADAVAGYGQAPFVIGSHTNFSSGFRNPGNGRVDEFAVWSRELTGTEITNQFATLPMLPTGVPVTNVIVNDSFADGNRTNTGPLQADWWSSSQTSGASVEIYTNQLGLVSGNSGRGLHGTFTPQTLNVGDTITATFTFTTPATVAATANPGGSFKFALMDFNDNGLAADLSSASATVNPLYTNLPGYMSDFDVNEVASNVAIRKHQVPNATGRFLGTAGEWDALGNSPSNGYAFAANTDYVGVLSVTRTGVSNVSIFSSMSQGATLMGSHSLVDESAIANHYGMVGVWANSSVFGSTNIAGFGVDNGITFSNITISVTTFVAPTLKIQLAGANVVLSWPSSASSSYALEATNALNTATLATSNWPSAGAATIVGNNYVVTNALSSGNQFYRLRKP